MATRKRVGKKTRAIKTAPEKSSPETLIKKSNFKEIFKKRNILILLGIVIVAGVLYYFKGLFVVALVNGQPITRLTIVQELEKRGGKQMLSSLITQALIEQEAQKRNVTVSQKEVDEAVKKVEDSLKKQGQSLDQALAFQGLTKNDFINQTKLQKLVEKLLAKDIKITDKEVNDYIEKNKNNIPEGMKPEEATASARQQLQQQKLGSKAQPWIQDLQKKAKINYFVNF